jgi:hypothetical protein
MLYYLQFTSLCRKSIRKKWSNNMVNASTRKTISLMVRSSMPAEVEKHMDGEIDALFV